MRRACHSTMSQVDADTNTERTGKGAMGRGRAHDANAERYIADTNRLESTPKAALTPPPTRSVKILPNAVAFARISHQPRQLRATKPPRSTGVLKSKMTSLLKSNLTYQRMTRLLKLNLAHQKGAYLLKSKLNCQKRTSLLKAKRPYQKTTSLLEAKRPYQRTTSRFKVPLSRNLTACSAM